MPGGVLLGLALFFARLTAHCKRQRSQSWFRNLASARETRPVLARIEADAFLEHVVYVSGHRYGTLRSELERIREHRHVPLLELETEGAQRVRAEDPRAVTIFVSAAVDELERRLRERATESTGEIGERIALAREQLEEASRFDYIVENDDLDRAVEELVELVRGLLSPAGTISRQ